ncbi:MAG: CorA family divalent cation transporter [Bacteroidota bacterium]
MLFVLLDFISDRYYEALIAMEEHIDELEDRIIEDADLRIRTQIHAQRQQLVMVRKSVQPFRELVNYINQLDSPLLEERTEVYFRNLHGQLLQLSDYAETYRDNLNSLQDLLLSELSNKTNAVMQLLTIVSTIFIPITFLAGIYGMNFAHMPELSWPYAYAVFWGIVAVVVVVMVGYFRRKRWL